MGKNLSPPTLLLGTDLPCSHPQGCLLTSKSIESALLSCPGKVQSLFSQVLQLVRVWKYICFIYFLFFCFKMVFSHFLFLTFFKQSFLILPTYPIFHSLHSSQIPSPIFPHLYLIHSSFLLASPGS